MRPNRGTICIPITTSGGSRNFKGEDNLLALLSFIAYAHNELYAFYTAKSDLSEANKGQRLSPLPILLWICHWQWRQLSKAYGPPWNRGFDVTRCTGLAGQRWDTHLLLGVHQRFEVNDDRCLEIAASLSVEETQLLAQLPGNWLKLILVTLCATLQLTNADTITIAIIIS